MELMRKGGFLMDVILSHTNLDFDGLASMIAAKKIHSSAKVVLPENLQPAVKHFISLYKDTFAFTPKKHIDWNKVDHAILVDTASTDRIGKIASNLHKDIHFTIYDHHPLSQKNSIEETVIHHRYGACVTIFIRMLKERGIPFSPLEATVFALGLYTDTGNFTHDTTTAEDLLAGYELISSGASLDIVNQFRGTPLTSNEQQLFQSLLDQSTFTHNLGIEVGITSYHQEHYTGKLASITSRLLDLTGADAFFSIVTMGEKTFVTARSNSDRVNVLPAIQPLGGGGHRKAASAMRKDLNATILADELLLQLPALIVSEQTAEHMMSSPVRVVAPDTTVADVSKMLYRYGHTGFPVIEKERLVGIISRRDIDKALHHDLGHAPVKGYMSQEPIFIDKDMTLQDIQSLMIEKDIGRLPVLDNKKVIGIVSRTDLIQEMHGEEAILSKTSKPTPDPLPTGRLDYELSKQLTPEVYRLIGKIGEKANALNMHAYLVGGIVRDILLKRKNEDIDIVVEGNAIVLGEALTGEIGGSIRTHEIFKTATWTHTSGLKIDLTSARTEYYDFPAALPIVEMSNIKEDLYRRDFTINAMGISLAPNNFGQSLDFFHSFDDLKNGTIRVLYNLSFVEDPTRILRAIRFENRFGFSMNNETESFAKQHVHNLNSVSKPRIANELMRMLIEETPMYFAKRSSELNLLPFLLEEREDTITIMGRFAQFEELEHALSEEKIKLLPFHWIGILYLMTKMTDLAFNECAAFTLNKQDMHLLKEIKDIDQKVHAFKKLVHSPFSKWHTLCSTWSNEALTVILSSCGENSPSVKEHGLTYLIRRKKVASIFSGNDLKQLGLTPGPKYRDWLIEAEAIMIDNPSLSKNTVLNELSSRITLSHE